MFRLTVLTSVRPAVLSKRAELTPTGLSVTSSAHMAQGYAEPVDVQGMAHFSNILDNLLPSQAVAYGVPPAAAPIVKADELPNTPGAIARSDKFFSWPAGCGVLMIDYDPEKGTQALSVDQLIGQLSSVCPALMQSAFMWRPSASSFIYTDQGQELSGLKGQRVYVVIADAADAPRAGDALFKRLWLAGFGRIEIALNGALMVKGPIDASVWQPSRLDFAAGAICGPGLQRHPWQSITNEGAPLDTRQALPDLSADEVQLYKQIVDAAKQAKQAEGQTVREAYIADKAQAEGVAPDVVRARYDVAEQQSTLCGDFELQTVRGNVTVAEVLEHPEQWHGVICLDPIEPEYRDGAMVGKIYTDNGAPNVDSKAHGGRVFHMGVDLASMYQRTAAPAAAQSTILEDIRAHGINPSQTEHLIQRIKTGGFNDVQRAIASATLQQQLKDAGLLTKELRDMIAAATKPADHTPMLQPPQDFGGVVHMAQIKPKRLSSPSGSHGLNARAMISEVFANRLAVIDGVLRWWAGNHWEVVREADLERLLYEALMPDQSKAPNVAGTIKGLRAIAPVMHACKPDGRVYFRNCVFDPTTGQTHPHDPANGNLNTLAIDFDVNAHPREWNAFLDSLFGGSDDYRDRVAMLQEIIGFMMVSGNLNIQKAIAFDGVTRGGKGVILDVLYDILGATAGSFTFAELANCKTQSVFRNYGVAIDSDAKAPRYGEVQPAISFLNRVTANEPVSILQLNKQDPWEGRTNCKMLIACNGVPLLSDDSGASSNRFELLRFTVSFEGREDHSLSRRVRAEATAIGMWAMYGLTRLIANGCKFTQPETSVQASESLSEANQPLVDFINECLTFDPNESVVASDVWDRYRVYACDANIKLMGRNSFYRALDRTLLGTPARRTKGVRCGDAVRPGWIGMKLNPATLAANVLQGAFTK